MDPERREGEIDGSYGDGHIRKGWILMAQPVYCSVEGCEKEGDWWVTAMGDEEVTGQGPGTVTAVCGEHWPIMLLAWLSQATGLDPERLMGAAAEQSEGGPPAEDEPSEPVHAEPLPADDFEYTEPDPKPAPARKSKATGTDGPQVPEETEASDVDG